MANSKYSNLKSKTDDQLLALLAELVAVEHEGFKKTRKMGRSTRNEIHEELVRRGFDRYQIAEKLESLEVSDRQADEDSCQQPLRSNLKSRIMYLENKSQGLEGDARIGRVYFSRTMKTLYYKERVFQSLKGYGFKSNYCDIITGDEFWISGPRKDRNDRLYGGNLGV
ncbi:MAG: hypothetical protein WEB58_03960, partial [Planctomycetaceae bacterium]